MKRIAVVTLACLAAGALTSIPATAQTRSLVTAVPHFDHVLIVVEENRSATLIGRADAPYITSLAASSANMTQSYAETHPSQPNYIALFSGSTQGVTSDACVTPFSADNLGAQLIGAGLSFTGYSESQPSVGYVGCGSGRYARKHNPWSDFSNVPAASNQPFTAFPSDYSTLPAVSFVVPNLDNDMHDGTIAQGDAWLRDNLDGYVQWAKTHNSLFVLTWDEDDNTGNNRIATVIAGANVAAGNYSETINHYSVLRTVQDSFGLAPLGASATAAPILDIFNPDPAAPTPAFTASCNGLVCSFDASTSTSAAGSRLTDYRWSWGDGTATENGVMAQHAYATDGDNLVTLTVTDDSGRSASVRNTVSPRSSGNATVFASDSFARTVTGGFGSADLGGSWSTSGSGSNYGVSAGAGAMSVKAGTTDGAFLPAVRSADTDVRLSLSVDRFANGNGVYFSVVGRQVGTNLSYLGAARIRSDGTVAASIQSSQGTATAVRLTAETLVPGLTITPGQQVVTRLVVTGTSPTTVKWKVWAATATEPSTWLQTTTDSTAALQGAGSVGVTTYVSGTSTVTPVSARIANFSARTTAAPVNHPPTASAMVTCTNLACAADGRASSDLDGTIVGYAWDWGDGSPAGTGAQTSHTYSSAATYTVTLTVTDNGGAIGSTTQSVTVASNQPPTASATVTCTNLVCAGDGRASSDPDGTIASYAWDWGDKSAVSVGAQPNHTYPASGTYTITLTVTDNIGATATTTRTVTVASATNQPPIASASITCTDQICSADGRASSDPDGSIAGYAWDWGDGSPAGSGAQPSHTYAAAKSYLVTLTVTDNTGATASMTQPVTVTAGPFAADAFNRTVAGGFGAADVGGSWMTTGPTSRFSVSGGAAAMALVPGMSLGASLPQVNSADTDLRLSVGSNVIANGNGTYVTVVGRRTAANTEYQARLRIRSDGSVVAALDYLAGSTTATTLRSDVLVPGVTLTPGGLVRMRLQVSGTAPTTIRMKAWATTAAEPAAWLLSVTDSTAALQAPGAIGVTMYLSSGATNPAVNALLSQLTAQKTSG